MRLSALLEFPFKYSHSARSSHRSNMSSYRRSQVLDLTNSMPAEISARRRIRCRCFGLSSGRKIQLCYLFFFVSISNERETSVELIHNIEDLFCDLVSRHFSDQQPTDAEMPPVAQLGRDEGIGCLLDLIVEELVRGTLA